MNWLQKIFQHNFSIIRYAALPDKIRFLSQKYNISEPEIKNILQYDPTEGKYLDWLIRQVMKQQLRLPQDGDKILETLRLFKDKSRFLDKRDINQYQTLGDIREALDRASGQVSKRENLRIQRDEGQEIILDKPPYQVVKITTQEAAAKLCRNTQWCIKDPQFFNEYSPKEYFIILKNGEKYALYHPNSSQLKDVYDRKLSKDKQLELLPILLDLGTPILGGDLDEISQEIRNIVPLEDLIKIPNNIYPLAEMGDRSEQVITAIAQNPELAYMYAQEVLKGRFPAGEPAIAQDAYDSCLYARNILKGRFPAGEPAIAQNTYYSYEYAKRVLEGRFLAGEAAIAQDAYYSYSYSNDILGGHPMSTTASIEGRNWLQKIYRDAGNAALAINHRT